MTHTSRTRAETPVDPDFDRIVARVERRERAERNVRLVGAFWAGLSALGLAAAAVLFLLIAPWGWLAGEPMTIAFFTGLGAIIGGAVALLSLPGLVAGLGLLARRGWARNLTLGLAVIALFQVPVGTILGIATLVVLLGDEAVQIFGAQRRVGPAPTR